MAFPCPFSRRASQSARVVQVTSARRWITAAALLAAFLSTNGVTFAQTTWSGANSGNWFLSGNWTNQVPTSSTFAYLNNGNTAIISQSGAACSQLYLGNATTDSGSLNVQGGSLDFYGVGGSMRIGVSGAGSLSVTDGGQVSGQGAYDYIYVGYNSGSTGSLTVDGANSMFTTPGPLYLGYSGTGSLMISNGGNVSTSNSGNDASRIGFSTGSSGTVTVDGANSTWTMPGALMIGDSGTGSLTISNGGQVATGSGSYIGYSAGSSGTVLITGANSTWNDSSSIFVGNSGTGSLTISNGGQLATSGGSSYIGYSAGSSGTVVVTGANSTWNVSSELNVGDFGSGSLTVSGGGYLSTGGTGGSQSYIGNQSGSQGSVTVQGPNSTWNSSGVLYVGNSGTGRLMISNGGQVATGSGSYVGYSAGSSGTVTVDGANSTWTMPGALMIGDSGTGSLTISNGGQLATSGGSSYIGYSAGSSGTVSVSGTNSTWTMQSSLYVGNSGTGSLMISNGGQLATSGSSELYVGNFGSGSLTVSGGGYLVTARTGAPSASIGEQSGALGSVTIQGPGSIWSNSGSLYVGNSGTGSLMISNGGSMSNGNSAGNSAFIGYRAGSSGTVTVDGQNSTWNNNSTLYVGDSGTGSLTISNAGSVSCTAAYIAAANGSSGGISIKGSGSTLNASQINIGGQSATIIGGPGSLTISSGGHASSNGTLNLWRNDSSVTVNNGSLSVGGLNGTTGSIYISDGGNGPALTINSTGTNTFSGIIADSSSGPGSLLKTGNGTQTLGGANTYTGGTSILGGTLQLGAAGALPSGTIVTQANNATSTFALNNYAQTIGGLNGGYSGGSVTLGTANLTINDLASSAYSGVIIGNGGLIIGGSSSAVFTLAGNNSYLGGTTIDAGTLIAAVNNALGHGGVTIAGGGVLQIDSGVSTGSGALSIAGVGAGNGALVSTGTSTFGSNINLTGNATIASLSGDFTLNGSINKTGVILTFGGPGTTTVNGQITGTTAQFNSDVVVSGGTVVFNNSGNNYFGPTTIAGGGSGVNGTNNALPTNTIVTVGSADNTGGTYDLHGFQQTVAGIQDSGTNTTRVITDTVGGAVLTVNNATPDTYNGLLTGYLGLSAQGTAPLTLTNGGNTYSGGTTVGGLVVVTNTTGSATGSGAGTGHKRRDFGGHRLHRRSGIGAKRRRAPSGRELDQ